MTQAKPVTDVKKIEFKDNTASTKKCKIFIKVKEAFKRAILYNKEV